ncbi:Flp family type IVb pilin [Dyella acidiphila]|uniref:Flp family type IVb pilin n=1 Tax=Dyella acidiphila TaxID=2775866 RepID=A0ABR9G9S8_9GAMM|nr:Flp family type IVb pilin [Dyella acidiphila]MBE1160813.1 Flp family type IVb pilin [Dyella acidiphila]
MNAAIRNFLVEEDGITALEYGILACLVAVALVAGFKTQLGTIYGQIMTALGNAVTSATT